MDSKRSAGEELLSHSLGFASAEGVSNCNQFFPGLDCAAVQADL